MKKTRAHHRHNLETNKLITGKIVHHAIPIQLLTMGEGGCGFWLTELDSSKIKIGEGISCGLLFKGQVEFVFKAEVLYMYVFPFEGKMGKCVGVKFVEDHQIIQSLLETYEALQAEDKLKQA